MCLCYAPELGTSTMGSNPVMIYYINTNFPALQCQYGYLTGIKILSECYSSSDRQTANCPFQTSAAIENIFIIIYLIFLRILKP